ncbi:hypothetical protein [Rhodococcoides yunnanense]|nr:hypothetical protein [Rhodococcus yunnanensis]
MTQPEIRRGERESGRPVWALLGLLAAVAIAVFIMSLGFSAA